MNVRLAATARFHYVAIVQWYRERSQTGAKAFRAQARSAVGLIREFPAVGVEVVPGLRRTRILGTPYSMFYALARDEVIVLGILHGRQSPAEWRRLTPDP